LFRRGEREELGDLKGSSTERAIAARDGGVSKQPFDLILSVFQESIAGGRRWKGVGILGINLGYVFRVGKPGRIYFVEHRVGNYGLRLSGSGGGVVVIQLV
jgi:hypothetical protein